MRWIQRQLDDLVPDYSAQPDIVDVHIYPAVVQNAANADSDIQAAATTDYGDVPHFLVLTGLDSAEIVIGETWGGALSPFQFSNGSYCWSTPTDDPTDPTLTFPAPSAHRATM